MLGNSFHLCVVEINLQVKTNSMMENDTIKSAITGNWEDQKVKLKQKYTQITDSDLNFQPGKKKEMLEKMQIKLGKTKEQLYGIINAL